MGGYLLGSFAVFTLSFFLSLFSGLTYYFIKLFSIKDRILFNSILIIILLSIFDWIKGNILWGFPWTPISVIWSSHTSTLAPFSYLGVWGYSLITYSIAVGVYLLYKKTIYSIYFFLPFILIFSLSNLVPKKIISIKENFNIKLVQPNIKQNDKWDKRKTSINLNKLINLTKNQYGKKIDLVVWPETAVLFDVMDRQNKGLLLEKSFKNIENLVLGGIRKEKTNKKKNL